MIFAREVLSQMLWVLILMVFVVSGERTAFDANGDNSQYAVSYDSSLCLIATPH